MINIKAAPYNATGGGITDDSAVIHSAPNAVSSQGESIAFALLGKIQLGY